MTTDDLSSEHIDVDEFRCVDRQLPLFTLIMEHMRLLNSQFFKIKSDKQKRTLNKQDSL